MSGVSKEETLVFVRDRVRVERTALGIVGGQNKVVEAVQDEASSTTLPGEPPEAKHLLLGEGQSPLRAHFPKAQRVRFLREHRARVIPANPILLAAVRVFGAACSVTSCTWIKLKPEA